MKLQDRAAAVTGGTRGIGRAIAEAFLAEGAKVVVNGRSSGKGKRALEEMKAEGDAYFVVGDVCVQPDIERVVDETVEHFGRIDILVNNAGGADDFAPVVEMSDETWQHVMDWNLNSTFWATRRALRYMIPQGWGRIINISSLEGKQAKAGHVQYVTAKHAVNGFTKGVAQEVGPFAITVNAICPGLILTDIVHEQGAAAAAAMGLNFDQLLETFVQDSALKRLNKVEEVAALAVLLASEDGAGITGTAMSVDGGIASY